MPFAGAGVAGRPAAAPVAAGIDMCMSAAAGLKVATRVADMAAIAGGAALIRATGAPVPATVRRAIIGLAIIGPVMIMGLTAGVGAAAGEANLIFAALVIGTAWSCICASGRTMSVKSAPRLMSTFA